MIDIYVCERIEQFMSIEEIIPTPKGHILDTDMDDERLNCVIGVPRYHENLFKIIKNNEEWLREHVSHAPKNDTVVVYRRKIQTPEDLKRVETIINDLRAVKSELFIDFQFHRKPFGVSIKDYITEFLRNKGIYNYYTFTNWYRLTVYPESGEEDLSLHPTVIKTDKNDQHYTVVNKKEILIIPLYIRLKKNKTYEQLRMINYTNASGTEYEILKVNPHHFIRDDPDAPLRSSEDIQSW